MRAADRAHTSTAVPASPAAGRSSGLLVAALATLALLMVWRPSFVRAQEAPAPAQETATRSHTVKAGETLWSLAARYYGDGHQWQTLARRNGIPTAGESPLKVGMRLSVPARPTVRGAKAAEVAAAPADSSVPKVALAKAGEGTLPAPVATASSAPAGSLAAQTAGRGNAGSPAARAASKPKVAASPAPSAAPSVAAAPVTVAKSASDDTERANLKPTTGTMMGERGFRRIGLADQETAMNSRKATEVVTVFHRDLPDAAEAERRTRAVLRPNTPAPRTAEYLAAPFVTASTSLNNLGRISARVGSPSTSESYPQRAIKTDEVELEAAPKQTYKVGDLLVAFVAPETIEKGQVVVLPTGYLEVVKAEAGKPALALVRRQSGRIEAGQHLLVAPATSAPWVKATPLDSPDVPTTIKWLDRQEAQPTLQSYFIIGAGSAKGLAAGDELAVYRRIAKGTTETIAASARVVRVDRDHATAVITKQYQTDITVGLPVRRFAKAP